MSSSSGCVLYAAGVVLMVVSPDGADHGSDGGRDRAACGIATSSFSIVMVAFGRNVPQEKRPLIFGVATAASSFGQFAFAPIGPGLHLGVRLETARWSISRCSSSPVIPLAYRAARQVREPDRPGRPAASWRRCRAPGATAHTGCW